MFVISLLFQHYRLSKKKQFYNVIMDCIRFMCVYDYDKIHKKIGKESEGWKINLNIRDSADVSSRVGSLSCDFS